MIGAEILMWAASLGVFSLGCWTGSCMDRPNAPRWRIAFGLMAFVEWGISLWLASWAVTIHLVRLALQ